MKGVILALLTVFVVSQASVQVAQEVPFIEDVIENAFFNSAINLSAHETEEIAGEDGFALIVREGVFTRNALETFITNKLETFRDVIINGNDNLPPLDPLKIAHVGPYVFRTTAFRATGNVNNLEVTGLQWYTVDEVSFSPLRMLFNLKITVPRLELTGLYDVRARLALFITHNAGGNFRIVLNQVDITTDARLGTNILGGGHLTLRSLDVNIVVARTTIRVDGMVGSSIVNSAINVFIQGVSRDVVDDVLEDASATVSQVLFEVINEVLKEYKLSDLIG